MPNGAGSAAPRRRLETSPRSPSPTPRREFSPPPDPRFVNAITTRPELETIFLNMHSAGLARHAEKR